MNTPSGKDLMDILINLLADQEGVKITYELEEKKDVSRVQTVAV
jgi:hypothetical protein